MATKMSNAELKRLLDTLDVDENGNVALSPDAISQIKSGLSSSQASVTYGKRDRNAKTVLKNRHEAEYRFYMDWQVEHANGAAENADEIPIYPPHDPRVS